MKAKYIILSGIITGLAALAALNGCKKEPVRPADNISPGTAQGTKEAATQVVEAIEQTTCPIMDGNKINKDIFVEYQGKKVYFCCPECVEEFNKDPEKYISKLPQFQK